jgi:hypothetical protein
MPLRKQQENKERGLLVNIQKLVLESGRIFNFIYCVRKST